MAIVGSANYKKHMQQDHSLRGDKVIKYTLENTGKHKKLVGTCEHMNFRSFAYFTLNIEEAKQSIRIDYLMKSRNMEGT